ncbi:hypothetical protein HN51_039453 [Arachis hypogaea]
MATWNTLQSGVVELQVEDEKTIECGKKERCFWLGLNLGWIESGTVKAYARMRNHELPECEREPNENRKQETDRTEAVRRRDYDGQGGEATSSDES